MYTDMKEYDKAIVSCKRIAYSPCGPDEYAVVIKPYVEPEQMVCTFLGPFESDEEMCDRIYHQWLKEQL